MNLQKLGQLRFTPHWFAKRRLLPYYEKHLESGCVMQS